MKKNLQDGEMMIKCPLFGWTQIVCAKCNKKPGHVAAECYKLAAPRRYFFLARICIRRAKNDPPVAKIRLWASLGCRSGLDGETFTLRTIFFDDVRKKNWSSPSVLVPYRNRPGVVDSVGREPLMYAKVENGVTRSCHFFARKIQEKRKFWPLKVSTFLSRIACCSRESTSA